MYILGSDNSDSDIAIIIGVVLSVIIVIVIVTAIIIVLLARRKRGGQKQTVKMTKVMHSQESEPTLRYGNLFVSICTLYVQNYMAFKYHIHDYGINLMVKL